MSEPFRITWALDAYDTQSDIRARMLKTLDVLSHGGKLAIRPTYVLAPEQLEMNVPLAGPWVAPLIPRSSKAMDTLLKNVKLEGLLKPMVIRQNVPSLNMSAKKLLRFAQKDHSDLVVLGTHGRKGLTRFVLGSFAETILLQAKRPVLIVGTGQKVIGEKGPIFYFTDLSDNSFRVFKQLLRTARFLGAPVEVVHVISDAFSPALASGAGLLGGAWVPSPKENAMVRERAQAALKRFVSAGQRAGIKVGSRVEETSTSVTQAAIDITQNIPCRFIALAGQSGPVASALMGSIARKVLRNVQVPVWISRV